MVVTVRSLGLSGLEGYPVFAECFLSGGLPAFDIVGLPDAAVREARERVRAAVKNHGAKFPVSRITVNLAPAGTKKAGTVYDLPILLGILAANGDLPPLPEDAAFLGELSLTGTLRGVTGVLPMALAAREAGIRTLYVPAENAAEATLAQGLTVYGPRDVSELLSHLRGETPLSPAPAWQPEGEDLSALPDFRDVMGQENAKRALEEGTVTVARAAGTLQLPARFQLICAMNPCRCGWRGHPSGKCHCSDREVERYVEKISGPLLDRVDLHVSVPSVEYEAMCRKETPESSADIKRRVDTARARQAERFAGTGVLCNAGTRPDQMAKFCALDAAGEKLMEGAFRRMGLTARSHDRILRVARTIADLEGSDHIEAPHLAEAIQFRNTDILKG